MENIRIAIVTLPYHHDISMLKYFNSDPRSYEVLEYKQVPMFLQYIQNDIKVRTSTRIAAETYKDDFPAFINSIKDDVGAATEVMQSFYNFYLDYLESIRYIMQDPTVAILYPMASTKAYEFDYYIVLEQDVEKIKQECEDEGNALLFELTQKRINEIVPTLPADKTVRLKVDYVPRDPVDPRDPLPEEFVAQMSDIVNGFYNDFHKSVEASNDSNPQSSNSTL